MLMICHKKYIKLFIIEQCLQFGHLTSYTNKKLNKYVFITKEKNEIFNLYDLRVMILKLYPLINALFSKPSYLYNPNFRYFKNTNKWYYLEKENYMPVQILFATTTTKLKYIVKDAANSCNMPFSTGRWLNGSLTASLTKKTIDSRFTKKIKWNVPFLFKYKHIKNFTANVQDFSLVILPDAPNNKMIWREAQKKNIPTLGLLNSSSYLDLNYVIFGDYTSPYIVSFFCNLIADLILKESIFCKYRQNINSSVRLHTRYINKKNNKLKKEKQLKQHFLHYFRTIRFQNKIKQNLNNTLYQHLIEKICYHSSNNKKKGTITVLKKWLGKLFTRYFINKTKKIDLLWLYAVWRKKWPFRPWSNLRYYNDLSLFFVRFKQTKWTKFWKNKGYVTRKHIKKFNKLTNYGISTTDYGLFQQYINKIEKNV